MKNSFSLKWSVFGVLVNLFKNVPLYLSVRHKLVKKFDARLLKNYESNGCYGSPPHIIKVKVIKEFVEKYHPKIFVETGTYYGDMVDSVSKNFDKIYSIELDPYLFKSSKKRFKSKNHIEIIQGDSSKKLKKVLEEINQPTLFWLDGHWSEGQTARGIKDTPILEELTTIFESKIFEHIIIIDDARCFGTFPSYPTLDELKKFVYDKKKNVEINVEFDSIRITPTNKFN